MKTKTEKTTIAEIVTLTQEYEKKANPTNGDLIEMINSIYDKIILKWQNIFDEMSNPTNQDAEDISEFIIELTDLVVVITLRYHSLDVVDAPYEITHSKLLKLHKHFTRILLVPKNKRAFLNELFSTMFCSAYLPSIRKAVEHRELVLKNKEKGSHPENN